MFNKVSQVTTIIQNLLSYAHFLKPTFHFFYPPPLHSQLGTVKYECTNTGCHIAWATEFCMVGGVFFSARLVSCHPSGSYKFEMAPTFFGKHVDPCNEEAFVVIQGHPHKLYTNDHKSHNITGKQPAVMEYLYTKYKRKLSSAEYKIRGGA